MTINRELIEKLNSYNLSLDELAYLYSMHLDLNWEVWIIPASLLKLKRYKYIDELGRLTNTGENILLSCVEFEVPPKPVVEENDRFDEIWLTFPIDDAHGNYSKTRQIRYNKPETRKAYYDALLHKTHDELMKALKNEIAYRKQPGKDNLLKYMYISYNWFNKQGYDNELIPEVIKEEYGKGVI